MIRSATRVADNSFVTAIRVVGDPSSTIRTPISRRITGKGTRGRMTKIVIDDGYRPGDEEPFMNERQREYFGAS
jgi:hypothetical protein